MIRHLVDSLAQTLMKGVASCDKPRVGACSLRSEDSSMGPPDVSELTSPRKGREPPERKHLSKGRKRNQ